MDFKNESNNKAQNLNTHYKCACQSKDTGISLANIGNTYTTHETSYWKPQHCHTGELV